MSSTLHPMASVRPSRDFAPKRRVSFAGVCAIIGFHGLAGYALFSGLAHDAVQAVKAAQKPLMASIVPEPPRPVPAPPAPLPPQKVQRIVERTASPPPPPTASWVPPSQATPEAAAPAIAAVQDTAPAPTPPAPMPQTPRAEAPAPVAPASPHAAAGRAEPGVACPGYQQSLQRSLAGAYERVGVAGSVKVQFTVSGTAVSDVAILSGPREYQRAVQAAVRRFECRSGGSEPTQVVMDISFRPE